MMPTRNRAMRCPPLLTFTLLSIAPAFDSRVKWVSGMSLRLREDPACGEGKPPRLRWDEPSGAGTSSRSIERGGPHMGTGMPAQATECAAAAAGPRLVAL